MSQIFISHVAEDEKIAQAITSSLEKHGYRTWYYERDALPFEPHLNQTSRAIEHSEAYMVIISEQSIGSNQVETELVVAHDIGKPIVPILIGLTFEEFKQRKPMWRVAIGAAVALRAERHNIDDQLPKLMAGLHNLGVLPASDTRHQILVRIAGFFSTEDGGFQLKRLVGNDIGFDYMGDNVETVHNACRNIIAMLIAKNSLKNQAPNIDDDSVVSNCFIKTNL